MQYKPTISGRQIFWIWLPLASTWFMMAVEQPFMNALVARLPSPDFNLAATGVALAIAFIIESPILLILSASTAIVEGRLSYLRLRNFTLVYSAALSLVLAALYLPWPFKFLTEHILALKPQISALLAQCGALLIPVPLAVGVRRFFQGVLIKTNKSSLVAAGTLFRFVSMGTTGLLMYLTGIFPGCVCAAAALSVGMAAEGFVSWHLSKESVRKLKLVEDHNAPGYKEIARFYAPLSLTGVIIMAQSPVLTFFLSRAQKPIESLAIYPVVNGFVFLFLSCVISLQEVIIAQLGKRHENLGVFREFLGKVGGVMLLMLLAVTFTPLSDILFSGIFGLSAELTSFAKPAAQLAVILPVLSLWTFWQRAVLMQARLSFAVTMASALELSLSAFFMTILIALSGYPGAYLSIAAVSAGRFVSGLYLTRPYGKLRSAIKRKIASETQPGPAAVS